MCINTQSVFSFKHIKFCFLALNFWDRGKFITEAAAVIE